MDLIKAEGEYMREHGNEGRSMHFAEWQPEPAAPITDVTVLKELEVPGSPRQRLSRSPGKSFSGGLISVVQEFEETRSNAPLSPQNVHEFVLRSPTTSDARRQD